jgi:hypothetical protein
MAADEFVRRYSRFIYLVIRECGQESADAPDINKISRSLR